MRVLLLNPPADPPVSRDYYCGHFTKGSYYWPPLDLLVMSGRLAQGHDVSVLDAVVEKLSTESAAARIKSICPDAVVSVTSAVSWLQDMAFLSGLKEKREVIILVSGDYARAEPEQVLAENARLDGIIMDFADNDICAFLAGERSHLRNIYTRENRGDPKIEGEGTFAYQVPRFDLFPLQHYHMPQSLHHPSVQVLTDFGCPFACDFCFMERVKHKLRDVDNVAEELTSLAELGIHELFLADQSFGTNEQHALEVCAAINRIGRGRFSWAASMRVNTAKPKLLEVMRNAGCHTLMFGVETPSQDVLDSHRKRITVDNIEEAFSLARKMGFRTLAHFIIGLTGENEASLNRLVKFAVSLDPDIASFNVAAPAWDTSFGERVRSKGWLLGEGVGIAGADTSPVWEQPGLPVSTILQIRNRAVRRFYMRPGYIFKQLRRVRSAYQLQVLFREGIAILKDCFTSVIQGRI